MPGTLYVVATPIGNLKDITLRALDILNKVDLIACEDTRETKKLLSRYAIPTPTISYHAHSTTSKVDQLIDMLFSGKDIALVTDAGTPGIQDPAGVLVNQAYHKQIPVVAIPGVAALTTALSIAGINADSFYFVGFLPKKKGRQTKWQDLTSAEDPIVLYESPYRVRKTLLDIEKYLGNRGLVIGRELTKKFEEIIRGDTQSLIEKFSTTTPKGEFVIIILPK
jgi:16S rRNA (cytidine1402-2'-O)-methyltransferase